MTSSESVKVFVVGSDFMTTTMYDQRGHRVVSKITDADVVHFPGGPDVNPGLYNETALPRTKISPDADRRDITAYRNCNTHQVKIGVARGAHLLNVLSGGALWQHADGHEKAHEIYDATFSDRTLTDHKKDKILVTSNHHQLMIPTKDAEILGFSIGVTKAGSLSSAKPRQYSGYDPEVVWYESTKSLCFQPNPEYKNHKQCTDYFFDLFNFIVKGK